jgi:hypothetical protein
MAPNIQDHIVDEVDVVHEGNTDLNATEQHVFQMIEHIGERGDTSDRTHRITIMVIAVAICTHDGRWLSFVRSPNLQRPRPSPAGSGASI